MMERETGIEPATNSLEGCDSTTELLPPVFAARSLTQTRRYDEAGSVSSLQHRSRTYLFNHDPRADSPSRPAKLV